MRSELRQRLLAASRVAIPAIVTFICLLGLAYGQAVTQVVTSLNFITPAGLSILHTQNNGIDVAVGSHFTGGSAPVANSCAGFSLAGGASDLAGTITYTSAATCSVTFGRAYTSAPTCMANAINAVTPAVGSVAATTTGFTATFAAAQTSFAYQCFGS